MHEPDGMDSTPDRKVSLVTGATSGIGLPTTRALAERGDTVIIVSRNPDRCARVAAELRAQTGNPNVEFIAADLSLMSEVRRAAREFRERQDHLNLLINNAGISPAKRRVTAEGYEQTFALNHLGHFLLTSLLLDLLQAGAPARVINVSSGIYRQGRLDFDDLHMKRKFSAMKVYANSKLANIVFTLEFARRMAGRHVTVNAMTPGLTKTNIGQDEGGFFAWSKRLADFFGGKPAEDGADTLIWMATDPRFDETTGRYYQSRKELVIDQKATDPGLARNLWDVSEKLAGLASGELDDADPARA